jgi:hypothetical protein
VGTWGTALYSDDLATDLRGDLRKAFGDGLSAAEAVDRLMAEYASSLDDNDEGPTFWLAVADTGWKAGRLDDRARRRALEIIDSGRDLARWLDGADRRKRAVVLAKLRSQLVAPPPAAKRIAKVVRSATDWATDEVVAFQLVSGLWTLMRVIGHHEDKGGRSPICELFDWTGTAIPSAEEVSRFDVRREAGPHGISQFLFQEPRLKKDKARIVSTGIFSPATQVPGGYGVFVWPFVDRLFSKSFGLG